MYIIKKRNVDKCEKIYIDKSLWGTDNYKPEVYAQIAHDSEGFVIKFTVHEKNPKCIHKNHLEYVHLDSCIEWFVNFAPEKTDKYFNFEINAAGAMNVGFRKNRDEYKLLTPEEINSFNIKTEIFDDYWTGEYKIPFAFIATKIDGYKFEENPKIKTNLYKCGDETEFEHYMSCFDIPLEKPDFHCPQYFGEMCIE